MSELETGQTFKGRGAAGNPAGRFAHTHSEVVEDEWQAGTDLDRAPDTRLMPDPARRIISRNSSPDLPFNLSINPYRGCEHGCIYCFARPSHSFLDVSPGLDFETRLFYKQNAAGLLEKALSRPGYRPSPIALGMNTDAYQPVEREQRVTRDLLEVLWRFRHPVSLLTKSRLVLRDIDLLAEMAAHNLVTVGMSITTLDDDLKRRLEPRTTGPASRMQTLARLSNAGIPTTVMVAPVIPALTDHELEHILEQAGAAGATGAGYVLLRLPHEVAPLFRQWLQVHYPQRAARVMSQLRQARRGKDYDARWGERLSGSGVYARLLRQRFEIACRRYGLNDDERAGMRHSDCSQFRVPGRQQSLF